MICFDWRAVSKSSCCCDGCFGPDFDENDVDDVSDCVAATSARPSSSGCKSTTRPRQQVNVGSQLAPNRVRPGNENPRHFYYSAHFHPSHFTPNSGGKLESKRVVPNHALRSVQSLPQAPHAELCSHLRTQRPHHRMEGGAWPPHALSCPHDVSRAFAPASCRFRKPGLDTLRACFMLPIQCFRVLSQ